MRRFFSRRIAIVLIVICSSLAAVFYLTNVKKTPLPLTSFVHSFPESVADVKDFSRQAMAEFDAATLQFVNISPENRSFENTVKLWDQIGKSLIYRLLILKSLPIVSTSAETLAAAEEEFQKIQIHLMKKLQSTPQIFLAIVSYLEKAPFSQNLTASEWAYVHQLAQSINTSLLPSFYQAKITSLKEGISQIPRLDYTYLQGKLPSKVYSDQKSNVLFSVLNLNVCFLPEKLPLLYGGVTPWSTRIEELCAKILSTDADVICLQEVFEEESALKLYHSLKDHYAHFYLNIAPKNFGFNEDTSSLVIGLNSGLFIASKFAIEDPRFTLFNATTAHMNRGVFDFKIKNQNDTIAHIFTTHLEAFATHPAPQFRESQLQQIVEKMKSSSEDRINGPLLLCGDLNIPFASEEPAERVLKEHFFDPYNKDRKEVTMENRTYVDFTEFWWKAHLKQEDFVPYPQILDYAVLLEKLPSSDSSALKLMNQNYHIETTVVPMNEQNDPLSALSDHHGQLTVVKKNSCK